MPQSKLLIFLLILSCGAVVFLPVFTFVFLYPSIDELLIRDAEYQARKVANHFSLYFVVPDEKLGYENITIDLKDEISQVVENFALEKVKVFSNTGEILYSTSSDDIGGMNDKDYFRTIVLRGKGFSKIVRKDHKTLEGRTVAKDVIETYVPIFGRDKVVGAFEIYYDITTLKGLFDDLVHRSTLIIYGISIILLSALLVSLFKLSKNMAAREQAEKALAGHTSELEQLVNSRTAELIATNRELQEDNRRRRAAEDALFVSEERYRSLVEMASDAIVIADAETGNIIDVNQQATELVGRPANEIIGLHLLALHPDNEGDLYRKLVDNQYKGVPINKILYVQHRSGRKVPVEIRATILDIAGRKMINGIFRDITQRLQVEEELQKSERLKTASILAGGIAHDFNNLLTAILGNISLAQLEARHDEKIKKRLADTENAVNRAKDLTHQLLTFAKGGTPVMKTVSLAALIEESASFVLHGSKVKCEYEIPAHLWPVNVDTGQISQVINNLVINASHSMEDGGLCSITAENILVRDIDNLLVSPGRYVKICIRDQGHGIPEDKLDRIFDPFYTTKPQGSGLGLSSAYSIVKNHGGDIRVESKVGAGTTFSILLPASEGKPEEEISKKPEVEIRGEGRILVMDDEAIVREAVTSLLQFLGYEVDCAAEGTAALKMYGDAVSMGRPYNAVIMDLTVPGGMGGQEAVKKLKEMDPAAKVIVSSGYYTDPVMAHYRDYGFDGVAPKPYQIEELGRVVRELLNGTV